MTLMQPPKREVAELIAGSELDETSESIRPVFSQQAIKFLSGLSSRLIKKHSIRKYTDIVSFAYWCRPASLKRMSEAYPLVPGMARVGRGLAFHVAPSNIPLNFAYSFAFGILSGCSNVVRLPSRTSPQSEIVCSEIAELFSEERHVEFQRSNSLVRFESDSSITEALSRRAAVRVIWGGDETVLRIRKLATQPRCVDICFSDRYSVCVLGATAIASCGEAELQRLVESFYNDVFLFDQNACSSPHLVLWQGNSAAVLSARGRFWSALRSIVDKKYELPPVSAVDKLMHLFRSSVSVPRGRADLVRGISVITLRVDGLPEAVETLRGNRGFFIETTDNDLKQLFRVVTNKFQTVTYFGVAPEAVLKNVVSSGVKGIDRIVPVGKALEMNLIWDGYDVIGSMSRVIFQE